MHRKQHTKLHKLVKNTLFFFLPVVFITGCNPQNKDKMQAPEAAKKPHEMKEHGNTRVDNYYWLNERENPEVIAYLEAENAYEANAMRHTEALQQKLYDEMLGRIKQSDISVPYQQDGYFYYSRFEEGKEYAGKKAA
jgi:oligopeptidase B